MYVQGTVDQNVYDEFIRNAILFKGPKHGHAGLSLEESTRLFNNYFKATGGKALVEVAKEEGLHPHEVGEHLIKRFMDLHVELGLGVTYIDDEEHLQLVKKHLKKD